jgi:transposase-like protein
MYPTEEACFETIFKIRALKETSGCIKCGSDILKSYSKINNRLAYQCANYNCKKQVYPLAGTIFERTHVPLKIWFDVAIDKIFHHNGISANELAYKYSLSDGTAWRLAHKIRLWMALSGVITIFHKPTQVDEMAVITGTKGLGKYCKSGRGFGSDRVTPVMSMRDDDGNVRSWVIPDRTEDSVVPLIIDHVDPNASVYTDEFRGYSKLKSLGYNHQTVNHSKYQWKNGNATTNALEGYFGNLKPAMTGTYRLISDPYLQNYLYEYDFRYNNKHEPLDVRFQKLLDYLPPLFEHKRNPKKVIKDLHLTA